MRRISWHRNEVVAQGPGVDGHKTVRCAAGWRNTEDEDNKRRGRKNSEQFEQLFVKRAGEREEKQNHTNQIWLMSLMNSMNGM